MGEVVSAHVKAVAIGWYLHPVTSRKDMAGFASQDEGRKGMTGYLKKDFSAEPSLKLNDEKAGYLKCQVEDTEEFVWVSEAGPHELVNYGTASKPLDRWNYNVPVYGTRKCALPPKEWYCMSKT